MTRLILTAALAVGLTLPIVAQGATRRRVYFWPNVAAGIRTPGQPAMPEVIRPSTIILFADGSWALVKLHWTGWALASGAREGHQQREQRHPEPGAGQADQDPGTDHSVEPRPVRGREVYRCYRLKVRAPATDLHGCVQGLKGFWFFATPPPARSQRSQMEVYARPPA